MDKSLTDWCLRLCAAGGLGLAPAQPAVSDSLAAGGECPGPYFQSLSREGSDWMQRDLLLAEGIPVDEDGRLPLKQCLWVPDPIGLPRR